MHYFITISALSLFHQASLKSRSADFPNGQPIGSIYRNDSPPTGQGLTPFIIFVHAVPPESLSGFRSIIILVVHNRLRLFAYVLPTARLRHLKAADVKDDEERKYWKFQLMKGLYQRGLERVQILELFRFIDWLIDLPEELNQQFWSELYALEEEKSMTYVTSVERMGVKKGIELGTEQGELKRARASIIEILEDKFDAAAPDEVLETVEKITDLGTLKALLKLTAKSVSMEVFLEKFGHTIHQ